MLRNALWYITNDHVFINATSNQTKKVTPIPKSFEGYVGYNKIKRKKVKTVSLFSDLLYLHALALYSLLFKSYVKSTGLWKQCQMGYEIWQIV